MKRDLHLEQCLCRAMNPALTASQRDRLEADLTALSPERQAQLFALADRTLLLASWHLGLKRHGVGHLLPPEMQEALEAAWLLNRRRNQQLRAEASAVSDALAEIECRVVFLKGYGHLLADTYRDGGARMMKDMDILVPAERLLDAAAHLLKKGFSPLEGELALEVPYPANHLDRVKHPNMITGVELHHQFLSDYPDWPSMPEILTQSEPVAESRSARTPTANHAAQIAVAHSALRYEQGLRLRDMVDFLFLIENRALDVLQVQRDFRRAGLGFAFNRFAAATDLLFGSEFCGAAGARTKSRWMRGRFALAWSDWLSGRRLKPAVLDARYWHSLATRPGHRLHVRAILTDSAYRADWRRRR